MPPAVVVLLGRVLYHLLEAALGGVSFGFGWGVSRAQRTLWREAARQVGLTDVAESDDGLHGRAGALTIRLSRYHDGRTAGTRVP